MIKRLISLAAMLIIGLLIYNTFFGTIEDKESVDKITSGVKELFQSTKEKYEKGEYNEAIEKIGNVFDQLKDKAGELNSEDYMKNISELEKRKQHLEEMLRNLEVKEKTSTRSLAPQNNTKDKKAIEQELEALKQEASNLAEQMDNE
ncbi:MAG: hypothetical protein ACI97N_001148 [Cognaticolwellia sp.]|jgi:hypothetical protein|tara:strand:- start:91 stop:531 length:441 start_codon:yes stop_codon:yes gene_type:complete